LENTMRLPSAKQALLLAAGLILFVSLIALVNRHRSVSVTILNPKFRLLTAKISYGRTHKLHRNPWLISEVSDLLARAGWNSRLITPLQVRMTNDSYALVVRFTGDFAPNELSYVRAERVDDVGNATPLWSVASSVGGETPNQYGRIWMLAEPLTNAITIRLSHGIDQPPLAEFRVKAR
jgi:hypothetical protein